MLRVTWLNTEQYLLFPEPDDFKIWVQGMRLSYKPYQLWNLNAKEQDEDIVVFAGVYHYIGRKYLGELILNKNESRARALLQKRITKRRGYEKGIETA